ncbi:MAG: hypothetical protein H0T42_14755 [Deltaproteobacteria bacterium]|nr:hypothetical protein [Deltaproteobacteria bacterium]
MKHTLFVFALLSVAASCAGDDGTAGAIKAYTDTFTLTNGLTADPWCKQ